MKRRDFVQICAATAACTTLPTTPAPMTHARMYGRARLVDELGKPVRVGALQVGTNYVFDYPYSSTPCFLLRLPRATAGAVDLRTESGEPYRWEGGVGEGKTVVAYSAI